MKKNVVFLLCLLVMIIVPGAALATDTDVIRVEDGRGVFLLEDGREAVILENGQLVITDLSPKQPFEENSGMLASDYYDKVYLTTYANENDIPQTLYLSEKKVNTSITYGGTVELVSKTWHPADQYWVVQYEGYLYSSK